MMLDIKSEQKWPLIVVSLRTAVKGHFFLSVFEIAVVAPTDLRGIRAFFFNKKETRQTCSSAPRGFHLRKYRTPNYAQYYI